MLESKITIKLAEEACTCCGDVIQLLDFRKDDGVLNLGYNLYKASDSRPKYDNRGIRIPYENWIYFILSDDDKFPMIISEKTANEILENPEAGCALVNQWWQDRYR